MGSKRKAKKKAKEAKKKAKKKYKKKMKKLKKKMKKKMKKLKKKMKRVGGDGKPPKFLEHEKGLTHDLLYKDLTMIPRKKLLQMAKVCKTRRRHYQYELSICVREKGDQRRACLNTFNKVKAQVEKRCSKLKELFSRIFTFIKDLRRWANDGKTPGKSSSYGKKGISKKKLKKMIKKAAKQTKGKKKEQKKEV